MFTRVIAFFKANDTHWARSSFVAPFCLFIRVQKPWYFLNTGLNGLEIFTSRGVDRFWIGI